MDKLVITYALVKTCWDQGGDYLDCFWPFAVRIMPADQRPVELDIIQKDLAQRYDFLIPIHSLRTILNRAQQRRHVDKLGTKYRLTDLAIQYLNTVESEKEVERRTNALFRDIITFFSTTQKSMVTVDEIADAILPLIQANIEPLTHYFNPSAPEDISVPTKTATELQRLLILYLKDAEKNKPQHYETLRDIFLGAIISTIVNAESLDTLVKSSTKGFKNLTLFLDTNFIFYILDLSTPEFSGPAKELLQLLKSHNIKTKAFSFTVDEICKVLNAYITDEHIYPASTLIDTLFNTLKRKGWTKTVAREFIMTIEEKLLKQGIEVELISDVNLKTYDVPTGEIRSKISIYKPSQQPFFQNHDLAAIDYIKMIRKHPSRRIEFSKALFLTSDKRLSNYNFEQEAHREKGTITEVILDSLLTNIIWLKDPNQRISLNSIIAIHSRDLFINRRIWHKFYETLKQLRTEGQIDEEALSTLFYGNYIEDELREFDETQVDYITPQFIIDEIEKARTHAELQNQKKEKDFIQRLDKERSLTAQQRDEEWLQKLLAFKKTALTKSHKNAVTYSAILSSLITIGILTLCWYLFTVLQFFGFIPLTIGGATIWKIWTRLHSYFSSKVANRIYRKRITEMGLSDQLM